MAPHRVIVVDIGDDVTTEQSTVLGDEDRLCQVIANVVGNALVHTDSDVPITLRLERVGGDVVVDIVDAGDGMEPDVAARVTERFFRADPSRSRHRGGSGLGLSIVDAAVAAHGGTVTIDSESGRGTSIRLALPGSVGSPATPATSAD